MNHVETPCDHIQSLLDLCSMLKLTVENGEYAESPMEVNCNTCGVYWIPPDDDSIP